MILNTIIFLFLEIEYNLRVFLIVKISLLIKLLEKIFKISITHLINKIIPYLTKKVKIFSFIFTSSPSLIPFLIKALSKPIFFMIF